MHRNIAIAVALVVVGGAFYMNNQSIARNITKDNTKLSTLPLLPSSFDLSLPGMNNSGVTEEAWSVFTQYMEFARTHNLEGLKSVSHQLSPACSDPVREEECFQLMDSLYFFARDFRKEDFKNIYADERQIVMTTDYLKSGDTGNPVKTVLYLTRVESKPKLLAIRFCLGEENGQSECVETDPAKRDLNGNGWWDDVEAFFR